MLWFGNLRRTRNQVPEWSVFGCASFHHYMRMLRKGTLQPSYIQFCVMRIVPNAFHSHGGMSLTRLIILKGSVNSCVDVVKHALWRIEVTLNILRDLTIFFNKNQVNASFDIVSFSSCKLQTLPSPFALPDSCFLVCYGMTRDRIFPKIP